MQSAATSYATNASRLILKDIALSVKMVRIGKLASNEWIRNSKSDTISVRVTPVDVTDIAELVRPQLRATQSNEGNVPSRLSGHDLLIRGVEMVPAPRKQKIRDRFPAQRNDEMYRASRILAASRTIDEMPPRTPEDEQELLERADEALRVRWAPKT